ncbi:sensor histidine kinase [Salinibacterium hongtaonis]|uniref:Histidine kinase/HSP90-like ATPase domain-containing protein n=1 Tax=Homoserinimonas hongtaonis TaxID=2079791 RepID=A0A2U1SWS8_9MICO|nr:ATP-binding protein [Salinibacterium hongtaonis]PWB96003.1 hypothetical protein DF220_11410 [Salinibacterium hongtaonis]
MARSAPVTPPPVSTRSVRRPISRASLEIVIARAVAVFGLLFGAQSLPTALAQRDLIDTAWWFSTVVTVYGLLVISLVASLIKRGAEIINAIFAFVFLIILVSWPLSVGLSPWEGAGRPWVWLMMTVSTAAAAVAFPVVAASLYLIVAPVIYGFVRLTPYGGSGSLTITALDVVYSILLGGAVLVIITMLRSAAGRVDDAQSMALARYLDAVREHATEVERVRVDSLVHDTVLTTFLSAARAETEEQRHRATHLARNAIVHLKQAVAAPSGDETLVPVREVVRRICGVRDMMRASFAMSAEEAGDGTLPTMAAESLYAATLQAMVNSFHHAGDESVSRWVTVRRAQDGVVVQVGDAGRGFVVGDIPAERLGVRVSIIERMQGVGGVARVDSTPGVGTVVTIAWPARAEVSQ